MKEMLAELARREKEANIMPDPDIDIFMKVSRNLFMSKKKKKKRVEICCHLRFHII
jgi:hypothetical protein